MVINNLLIRLKRRDNESVMKAKDMLLSMEGKIEVLRHLQVETDMRHGVQSYDILLITRFSSMEDMEYYLAHPAHVEVSRYIAEVLEASASVCYEE